MIRAAANLIALLLTAPLGSETVEVRERGAVDLAPFECRDITRSSLIQRVCYDQARRHLVVAIRAATIFIASCRRRPIDGFMTAPSMGQFFKENIRAHQRPLRLRYAAALTGRPQSVSMAPTSASATTAPLTLASP